MVVFRGTSAWGREVRAQSVIWLPWLPWNIGGNHIKLVRSFRVSSILIDQKIKHNYCSRVPKHESESSLKSFEHESKSSLKSLCVRLKCDSSSSSQTRVPISESHCKKMRYTTCYFKNICHVMFECRIKSDSPNTCLKSLFQKEKHC